MRRKIAGRGGGRDGVESEERGVVEEEGKVVLEEEKEEW